MTSTPSHRCPACPQRPGGITFGEGVSVVWAPSENTHVVMWRAPGGERRRKRAQDHQFARAIAIDVSHQLSLARRFNVAALRVHGAGPPQTGTVVELAREFVQTEAAIRGWSAGYIDSIDGLIRNHVARELAIPLAAWNEATTLQALSAARQTLGASKTSQLLSLLRQTARFGIQHRRLLIDPTASVRVPMPHRHLTTALVNVAEELVLLEVESMPTTAALEAMASAFDTSDEHGLAARVAGYAGTRFAETFALEREDIDFAQNTISVERQVDAKARARAGTVMTPDGRRRRYWRTPYGYAALPKGDKPRKTLLPPQLIGELEQRPSGLLFPNSAGHYLANQTWWNNGPFRRARLAANWPQRPDGRFVWTWHSLRHHAATWLLEQGVPIHDVSHLLGHAQIETTLRMYVHSDADAPTRAAERISNAIRASVHPPTSNDLRAEAGRRRPEAGSSALTDEPLDGARPSPSNGLDGVHAQMRQEPQTTEGAP